MGIGEVGGRVSANTQGREGFRMLEELREDPLSVWSEGRPLCWLE